MSKDLTRIHYKKGEREVEHVRAVVKFDVQRLLAIPCSAEHRRYIGPVIYERLKQKVTKESA